MAKKKCGICGKVCAKYLYGMPDFERVGDDLSQGKIALGGCLINPENPDWKCVHCSIDYYPGGRGKWVEEGVKFEGNIMDSLNNPRYSASKSRGILKQIKKLLKLDVSSGTDIKGDYFHFTIDNYGGNNMEVLFINGMMIFWDFETLRHPQQEPCDLTVLSSNDIKELEQFWINSKWDRRYEDRSVLEGVSWSLNGRVSDCVIDSSGYQQFPEVYNGFLKLVKGYRSAFVFGD